jgi:uncharacterized membrane protein YphA (DoxX/SURF4 family)
VTTDLTLFILRSLVGAFFILYRFRWVYDPAIKLEYRDHYVLGVCLVEKVATWNRWFNEKRHRKLEQKLMACGYAPKLAAPVAVVELAAGAALIVGLLTQLAALGLFIILIAATIKTAKEKIALQKPVDRIDVAACYLWLCEPQYIALCLAIVLMGPGAWSLDALLGWIV